MKMAIFTSENGPRYNGFLILRSRGQPDFIYTKKGVRASKNPEVPTPRTHDLRIRTRDVDHCANWAPV